MLEYLKRETVKYLRIQHISLTHVFFILFMMSAIEQICFQMKNAYIYQTMAGNGDSEGEKLGRMITAPGGGTGHI